MNPFEAHNSFKKLRFSLALCLALIFSAVFYMNYFFDGSSTSKYICQKIELERVNESDIQAYSDQMLFGDPIKYVPADIDLTEKFGNEEAFRQAEIIRSADKILVFFLFILVWVMLIPKFYHIRWLSFIYLVIGLYLIALSTFSGMNGGAIFSELSVPAHACRWLPFIALWIWLFFGNNKHFSVLTIVKWLLVIASSLTFLIHGYEAFKIHPKFKDLLYGAFDLISLPLSETVATVFLKLIGIMDIFLAIAVIFYHSKWKWLLIWMTLWGFITALSRPLAFGVVGIDDAMIRIVNGAIPLIAFYLIVLLSNTKKNHYEKD